MGALTFSFVSPEEAHQWVKDYYEVIENECEPLGYAVNPNFAVAAPFLCDRDQERVEQIGAESYGFFLYGLGHYSFFGEHRPAKTDIWDEYKNQPEGVRASRGPHPGLCRHARHAARALARFRAGRDRSSALHFASRKDSARSAVLFHPAVLERSAARVQGARSREPPTKQAERRARINEKAMARKPKVEAPKGEIIIRAAGHH